MTWNATRPVFVIGSLHVLQLAGHDREWCRLSRRTISAADYFVDEDAVAMLE